MSQPIESTYLGMLFLMRPSSPFLPCLSHPPQHHLCIHLLLCLANLKMLHIRLCCYLIMVQELDVELAWNSSLTDPLRRLWCTSIGRCMHRLPPSTPHRAPRLQPRLGRSPCWLLRPGQSLRRPPLSSLRRHLLARTPLHRRPRHPRGRPWCLLRPGLQRLTRRRGLRRLACCRLVRRRPARRHPVLLRRSPLDQPHLLRTSRRPRCLLPRGVHTLAAAVALFVPRSAPMARSPILLLAWLMLWMIQPPNHAVIKPL